MKKILFLFVLVIISFPAYAQEFDYTGLTAQDIDTAGWVPNGTGAIGGPLADNRLGLAEQFTVSQETNMSALDMTATVFPQQGTTTLTYDLYADSANVPELKDLVLTSQSLTFSTSQQQDQEGLTQTIQEQIPFNYDLEPGTYWLAQQGTGGTYVSTQQSYIDPSVVAPEPSTVWLMFFGLLGLMMCRKHLRMKFV